MLLKQCLDHALSELHHLSLIRKRQLYIDLSEFWLTISAQVLIAETSSDLIVTVKTRDHQQLLEELRRLRQRKEF